MTDLPSKLSDQSIDGVLVGQVDVYAEFIRQVQVLIKSACNVLLNRVSGGAEYEIVPGWTVIFFHQNIPSSAIFVDYCYYLIIRNIRQPGATDFLKRPLEPRLVGVREP